MIKPSATTISNSNSPWSWPQWVAHRGGGYYAPENTLLAFQTGLKLGAKMMECDVQLTRDAKLVVIHDNCIFRTTHKQGMVRAYYWQDIKDFFADREQKKWQVQVNKENKRATVPHFYEILMFCVKNNLSINIEIKAAAGDEQATTQVLAKLLREALKAHPDFYPQLLISSYSKSSLKTAQVLMPTIPRAWLTDMLLDDDILFAQSICATAIHLWDTTITKAQINRVRKLGLALMVYTVNDRARANWLFENGVNAICTDNLLLIAGRR